jgi:hypothetical protein
MEIRVKHPHQLLPKPFQPVRLLRVEFPFPLQRRCRGIVPEESLTIDDCRLLIFEVPDGQILLLSSKIQNQHSTIGIHQSIPIRQAVPRCFHQPLVKLHLRLLEHHQPGGDGCSARILLNLQIEKRRILQPAAVRQLPEIPAAHRRTPFICGLRQPLQPCPQLRILPRFLMVWSEPLLVGTAASDARLKLVAVPGNTSAHCLLVM